MHPDDRRSGASQDWGHPPGFAGVSILRAPLCPSWMSSQLSRGSRKVPLQRTTPIWGCTLTIGCAPNFLARGCLNQNFRVWPPPSYQVAAKCPNCWSRRQPDKLLESAAAKFVDLQDSGRWLDSYAVGLRSSPERAHLNGPAFWDARAGAGMRRVGGALMTHVLRWVRCYALLTVWRGDRQKMGSDWQKCSHTRGDCNARTVRQKCI